MPRYKITIEYEGTNYVGWQKQDEKNSVEKVLEDALYKLSQEKVKISGSGRTDAGVHAIAQTAHFDLQKNFRTYQIMMGLNDHLSSSDVVIINCEIVEDNFHSRFDAKMRHYQYDILNRHAKAILQKNRVWQIKHELDLKAMRAASKYLIGKHDFSSFRDAKCQTKSPIKTISSIKITKKNDLISITISARSFLQHMVRNIVGTLVLVGRKKIPAVEMKKILNAKDRTKSGPNAPSAGLYLLRIDY